MKRRKLRAGDFVLDLDSRPRIVGILNVTPDSFSDGGLYMDPGRAEERALRLEAEGADIVDIGAESTRPGAQAVPVEEELRRLLPVLKRVVPKLKVPVSVDAYKFEVMECAVGLGVSMVNDVYGLCYDKRAARFLGRAKTGVVLMHMRGDPSTMQQYTEYADLEGEVESFLKSSLRKALSEGIERERMVVDPGIGFGKSAEGNFSLIRAAGRFKRNLRAPVMIGLSRKSFLRKIACDDAELASANDVMHALALSAGADLLRVHDVARTARVVEFYMKTVKEESRWKKP